MANEEMTTRIHIIGAGIAGLSLACHLQKRQIPFKIFERGSKLNSHNYGITLSNYDSLLQPLNFTADDFIEKLAVDRLIGGKGRISQANAFKASDARLREVLCRFEVSFNHNLKSVTPTADGLKLSFENGVETTAKVTIDASGSNSPILNSLLPTVKPTVLPYAVYHGSRYVREDPGFNEHKVRVGNHHLELTRAVIKGEDVPGPLKKNFKSDELVFEVRYTISRPALDNDPLFNPNRSKESAKDIPEEFYAEVGGIVQDLQDEWLQTFLDPEKLRNDRILNWLMRCRVLSKSQLQELANTGVFPIGDAAHGLPILGSEGANIAIADAVNFDYDSRFEEWEKAYERSLMTLRDYHDP